MNTNTKHWASITAGILSLAGYASAANLGSEKYTYDASGNIIEKSIDGKITKMSYETSNRLLDKQVNGQSTTSISYDSAGRPLAEQTETGKQLRTIRYGYGDKVLEVGSRGHQSGFYYNAEGQLVGRISDGDVSIYGWDGNALAAEGINVFTNETHITGGVPQLEGGGGIVVSDYLGNSLAIGKKCFASTAYGEGLEKGRFTGKPFVKELDSYVFHHRLYSPESNRWTVADPSGFPDGQNAYTYVSLDPLSRVDPLGLEELEIQPTTYCEITLPKSIPASTGTYVAKIKFKVTSTYSARPTAAEGIMVTSTGTPVAGYSWSSPTADLRIPQSTVEYAAYGEIVNGKARWKAVRFHHDAVLNTPAPNESHDVINFGDMTYNTLYAREN